MRSTQYVRVLVALLAIVAATPARSDVQVGDFYLAPMIGRLDNNGEKRHGSDTSVVLGFGKAVSENWNIEGVLHSFSPSGLGGQDQTGLGVDLQRVFRRQETLTPYLFVGVGLIDAELNVLGTDDSAATWAVGAGVLVNIFGDSRTALRAEYRRRGDRLFSTSGDDDIVSLGIQFPIGRRAAAAPAPAVGPDADGDGTPNGADRCPRTPSGVRVDANGCEVDADADGIVDRLDRCANTRAGAAVDNAGCEIRDEIRLPGVNFETNSAALLPAATGTLEAATATLIRNPQLVVEVAGHTDSAGDAAYNLNLSERRAAAVRAFFIGRGIAPDRLTSRGYGETQPIADNGTAAGRAMNRRVVLRVLSGN